MQTLTNRRSSLRDCLQLEIPVVAQIEIHPYNQHRDIVEFCEEHKIALEAYAPLTRGYRIKDPQLAKVRTGLHYNFAYGVDRFVA